MMTTDVVVLIQIISLILSIIIPIVCFGGLFLAFTQFKLYQTLANQSLTNLILQLGNEFVKLNEEIERNLNDEVPPGAIPVTFNESDNLWHSADGKYTGKTPQEIIQKMQQNPEVSPEEIDKLNDFFKRWNENEGDGDE